MDGAQARALAESVLAPGEPLLWWQAAPAGSNVHELTGAIAVTIFAAFAAFQALRYLRKEPQFALVMGVGSLAAACFGVYCWGHYLGGWSRVYVITEGRVVIASRDPWLQVKSFGPQAFSCWRREGDRIEFALGRRSTRAMSGLQAPDEVQALIRAHVAPRGARVL